MTPFSKFIEWVINLFLAVFDKKIIISADNKALSRISPTLESITKP